VDEANQYIKEGKDFHKVFPFTPDVKAQLHGKIDAEIINPLNYFSDFGHKRIIARLSNIEREIFFNIDESKELSEASKETFRGLFHLLASSIFYLHYNIRMLGPWVIYNNGIWQKFHSVTEIEKLLIDKFLLDKEGPFNLNLKTGILFPELIRAINNFHLKKLVGKKVVLFSGSDYGLPKIKQKVKNIKDNWILNILNPSNKSILKSLISFAKNTNNEISIINIPKRTNSYNSIIATILSQLTDPILFNVRFTIEKIISRAITYNQSIENYVRELFSKSNIDVFITHQLRWLDGAVFGQIAKENNVPSILISHGTHPMHDDFFSIYEHKDNARGLLFSPLAKKTFIQSPNTISSFDGPMDNVKKIRSKPLMWGNDNKINNNNDSRIILHAGTFKELGMRPWIYETSNEYIHGLQLLVDAVSQMKDTLLLIKIRPNMECNIKAINKLLPYSKNYRIITKGSFQQFIEKARLLVSFSSTTIEEALYARTPVGLFGGTSRYRHLNGSIKPPSINTRHAVYHLNKNNLIKMLHRILDFHESPLTDEELNKYTWQENVSNHKDFINHI